MAVFFIVVTLMIVATVCVLLWPLLRAAAPDSADRKAVNLAIAKQRMRELGRENDNGTLDDAAYKQAKYELELTLAGDLDDVEDRETKVGGRWMGVLLVVAVPVVASWLYFQLGSPRFLDATPDELRMASQSAANSEAPPNIDELIAKLEQRMEEVPTDAEGRRLLIRTYMSQGRFADAVDALNSWGARDSGNPDLLVMLADATGSLAGGSLIGEPEEYLEKALKLDPNHSQALWVMGYSQAQKNRPMDAIAYWERLLPLVSEDEASRQRVMDTINEAKQRAGLAPSEASPVEPAAQVASAGAGLTVTVSLDPEVAAKVSADDAVFIYAKTPTGPPMPLAVMKRRVSDLPLTVTLDDSSAMIPSHTLSGQSSVTVGARVSMGGGPVAQAGDYYIELEGVATPSSDAVELSISQLK